MSVPDSPAFAEDRSSGLPFCMHCCAAGEKPDSAHVRKDALQSVRETMRRRPCGLCNLSMERLGESVLQRIFTIRRVLVCTQMPHIQGKAGLRASP